MYNFKRLSVFFLIGSLGYTLIEILWRGHTHWSMIIAGGLCFSAFSFVAESFKGRSRLYKAGICAIIITLVELIFGIIFNIILKMDVWDYTNVAFNLSGQICPLFSFVWLIFGYIFIPLAEKINEKLKN